MSEMVLNTEQRSLIARAIGYGLSQPDMSLTSNLYEKALTTICDTLVKADVVTDGHATALKTDLRTKQASILRCTVTNIATEIAHSMNRKGLLTNEAVEPFIEATMKAIKNEAL